MKTILKAVLLVSLIAVSNPDGFANETSIREEGNLSTGMDKNRRLRNRARARVRNNRSRRGPRRTVRNRPFRRNINRTINRNFRRYSHTPYRRFRTHHNRYNSRRSFNRILNRRHVYNNRWVRWATSFNNGYYWDDYPFYNYNGYRHRYSSVDYCDYQLVDSYDDEVVRDFSGYTCNVSYDRCSNVRDDWNDDEMDNRYFCSEETDY